jgi:hypothetical protein
MASHLMYLLNKFFEFSYLTAVSTNDVDTFGPGRGSRTLVGNDESFAQLEFQLSQVIAPSYRALKLMDARTTLLINRGKEILMTEIGKAVDEQAEIFRTQGKAFEEKDLEVSRVLLSHLFTPYRKSLSNI